MSFDKWKNANPDDCKDNKNLHIKNYIKQLTKKITGFKACINGAGLVITRILLFAKQ